MKQDKICFYIYSPKKDIGHIMRILRILRFLKKRSIKDTFLIYNSPKHNFKNEIVKNSKEALFICGTNNTKRIMEFINSRKITTFVTEFYPFGKIKASKELDEIIIKLGNKIKIISILPIPYFVHSSKNIINLYKILRFYKKILITSMPEDLKYFLISIGTEKRIKKAEYIKLFKDIREKTRFVGYIFNNDELNKRFKRKFDILLSLGGGSTSHKIPFITLKSLKMLKNKYKTIIVCGINYPQDRFKKLKKLKNNLNLTNVKICKHTKNFLNILSKSELVISTAGSTAYDILYFSKKAILIPYIGRKGKEHSDQIARSLLLKDKINVDIINEKELNHKKLSLMIEKKIKEDKKIFRKKTCFNGLKNILKNL